MSLSDITGGKPWYQSRAIWGGIVSIAAPIAGIVGVQIAPDTAADIVTLATTAGGVVGGALSVWGRLRATTPIGG